jgi:hypothetical protein
MSEEVEAKAFRCTACGDLFDKARFPEARLRVALPEVMYELGPGREVKAVTARDVVLCSGCADGYRTDGRVAVRERDR